MSSFPSSFFRALRNLKSYDLPLKYNKKSTTASRDHINSCNHQNSPENVKIIGTAKNDYYLRMKGSLNTFVKHLNYIKLLNNFL